MRICYLADGQYIHARRWMSFFKNRGHDMHLVSFAPLSDEHVRALESIGVRFHGSIGAFHLKRWWLTVRDLKFLRSVLKREKIDVLHSHYLGANAWYAALSNFRPLVLTVMGGGDVTGPDWAPQGLRERLLTPYALRKADAVTSWSKVMADAVRPYCRAGVPVEVIHGGVNFERCYPGPAPDYLREQWQIQPGMKVIFSARLMRPLSNITLIADATQFICERIPDAVFLFAAPREQRDLEYEAKVRDIVAGYGLLNRVRFVGAIPHDQIADYYRLADITVSIPSTDGTPMTVLESMASGTPVICGDIPDYDTQYFENEKTVLMADISNPHSVAEAIVRLFEDKTLATKIAAEARRRVMEHGGYEAQMFKMERLYQDVVRHR